jgi:1-phosphofructokinase family hexose kinase
MLIFLGPTPALARVMEFNHLTPDTVNRATRTTVVAAGKSINAARAAITMGATNVAAIGFAGGTTGQDLLALARATGITTHFTQVAPPTRVCITAIDHHASTSTELVEESAEVQASDYEKLLADLTALLATSPPGVLVLSGSLTPAGPPDFYARCVQAASQHHWQTIVDATGEPLKLALAHRPTWIKPNSAEFAQALNLPASDEPALKQAAAHLSSHGTSCLITRGPAGAWLATSGQCTTLTVPKIQPISPIGSGDSVTGVLAAQLARGASPKDAAKLALAAGVANALTPLPAVFQPSEVFSFAERISALD